MAVRRLLEQVKVYSSKRRLVNTGRVFFQVSSANDEDLLEGKGRQKGTRKLVS